MLIRFVISFSWFSCIYERSFWCRTSPIACQNMRCVHATLLLLICAYNVAAGPFRRSTTLPITHEPYIESRQDGTTDLKAALRSLDRTRNKYDAHRSLKRRGGATNGTRINNEKLSSQTKRAPGGARAIVPMVSSRLDHDFDVQRTPFVRLEVKGVPDYFTVIFDTASVGLALPGQYCIRDCNGKKYPNSGYPLVSAKCTATVQTLNTR